MSEFKDDRFDIELSVKFIPVGNEQATIESSYNERDVSARSVAEMQEAIVGMMALRLGGQTKKLAAPGGR